MELLCQIPREHWGAVTYYGMSLLHLACRGPNLAAVVALLQCELVDMDKRADGGWTSVHAAAGWSEPRVLEVLCAAGAKLHIQDSDNETPIEWALWDHDGTGETLRVLVANGVRLRTVHEDHRHLITPKLKAFERGVLRCRAAVVAMLRAKKAANLYHVDKFLMRELAYAMWATRTDEQWQDE